MESPCRILAASDAENLELMGVMLPKLGYTFEAVSTGDAMLEKLKKSVPDLAIIDAILPRKSGWEVLTRMKEDASLAAVPVILLSDIDDVKEKIEAFEQGAEDYITKPFNFTLLLARIRSILRTRKLLDQLSARDERLLLAESFYADFKGFTSAFAEEIKSVDEVLSLFQKDNIDTKTLTTLSHLMREKIGEVKKGVSTLDVSITNASLHWRELKRKEVELV